MVHECHQALVECSRSCRHCLVRMIADSKTQLPGDLGHHQLHYPRYEGVSYFAEDGSRRHSLQSTPRYHDGPYPMSYEGRSFFQSDGRPNPSPRAYAGDQSYYERSLYGHEYQGQPPGSVIMDGSYFPNANVKDFAESVITQPILSTSDRPTYNHLPLHQKYRARNVSFRNDIAEE